METITMKVCECNTINKNKSIVPEGVFGEFQGMTIISKEKFNKLTKDRLDFGFDSIYFRYAAAVDELSYYKEKEARREAKDFDRKRWADGQKMHFYACLEQLLRAHEGDNNDINK